MTGERHQRTARLTVRLTPDERRVLDRRADACRLSTAAFVRRAALGEGPRRRRHATDRTALRRLDAVVLKLAGLVQRARAQNQPEIEDALWALARTVREHVAELAALVREER